MKDERKEYLLNYAKSKLKRVPLDLKIADYEKLKQVAEQSNETVNGYIKKAIKLRMETEDKLNE